MSLTNKRFKNNFTGDVVSVIDSFEHIAILEDKQKIDSGVLLNKNLYTEVGVNESAGFNTNADVIDPSTFFQSQNSYDQLASKIKNIDSSHIVDEGVPNTNIDLPKQSFDVSNESAIIMADEDDERAKLMAKYGAMDNNQSLNSQHDAFAKILGEDADLPEVERVYNPPFKKEQGFEQVERFEVDRDDLSHQVKKVEDDPIVKLFQGVKRSVNFSMNIGIDGKIPRIDFIEMMEDSYEKSLIDFLAEEFTNKILDNPSLLNEKIKETLMFMVYGEVKKETKEEVKLEKPKRKYTKKAKKEDKE